jgi:hypothetical protein
MVRFHGGDSRFSLPKLGETSNEQLFWGSKLYKYAILAPITAKNSLIYLTFAPL